MLGSLALPADGAGVDEAGAAALAGAAADKAENMERISDSCAAN